MSLKLCTAEYMISDTRGLGVATSWLPRIVSEQFLQSTKDGDIKLSPDPVTMIEGALAWNNPSQTPQRVFVAIHRAPRSIVAQSPATVVIHDAWCHKVGVSPQADYPTVSANTFGGRMQLDRPNAAPADLLFGRYYLDGDDSQSYVDCGIVPPGYGVHFRFISAVQTPNVWTTPTEFDPRWEANARWVRLVALAQPALGV